MDATRKNYERFCREHGTRNVISVTDYDLNVFKATDDGEWYDYCVDTAKNLLYMGWTPEERGSWEDIYGIFGATADKIVELMREIQPTAKEA